MKCGNCGGELSEGVKFCSVCGVAVEQTPPPSVVPESPGVYNVPYDYDLQSATESDRIHRLIHAFMGTVIVIMGVAIIVLVNKYTTYKANYGQAKKAMEIYAEELEEYGDKLEEYENRSTLDKGGDFFQGLYDDIFDD